nr:hypothetical protein [uncultured Campylobacter sp.]
MFLELDQIARELDENYLPLEQEDITGRECRHNAALARPCGY